MTHLLPPNLLRHFAPRPPLPYFKPLGRDRENDIVDRRIDGLAGILEELREQDALKEAEREAEAEAKSKSNKKAVVAPTTTKQSDAAKQQLNNGDGEAKKEEEPDANADDDGEMGEIPEEDGEQAKTRTIAKNGISADDDGMDVDGAAAAKNEEDEKAGLTYTEAEKLRLRRIERKQRREDNFKRALATCECAACFLSSLPLPILSSCLVLPDAGRQPRSQRASSFKLSTSSRAAPCSN